MVKAGAMTSKFTGFSSGLAALMAAGALLALPAQALPLQRFAQEQTPKAEGCPHLLSQAPVRKIPASVGKDQMRLTFVGHATFLIETPAGVKAVTDYNDYVRPADLPTVITMNGAHSTHFSHNPPAAIPHVLRGWDPRGGAAAHDITVQDMRIRNVVTNLRDWGGGTDYHGNSMFVFEASLLCVAHLGHLHHELTQEHLKQLGRIDVALVPVDGSMTLNREGMLRVVRNMGAPMVVPMHFFSQHRLRDFLDLAREAKFEVRFEQSPSIMLSREMLPRRPTVVVLPGH